MIENYLNIEITGKLFNKLTGHKILIKFFTENDISRNFLYKTGLNKDFNIFTPHGSCKKGGLYFTQLKYFNEFMDFGPKIAFVTIPDDARVYCEDNKWKANKIIIGERMNYTDFFKSLCDKSNLLPDLKNNFRHFLKKEMENYLETQCCECLFEDVKSDPKTPANCVDSYEEECSNKKNILKKIIKQYDETFGISHLVNKYVEKNIKIIHKLIKKKIYLLKYIPNNILSHADINKLIKDLVKENGSFLKYVPVEIVDYEICLDAVKNDGSALKFVPKNILDKKICMIAMEIMGNLQDVPIDMRDRDVSIKACSKQKTAYEFVPKNHHDEAFWLEVIRKNYHILDYLPYNTFDHDMWVKIIEINHVLFKYVPNNMKDDTMCRMVVEKDYNLIEHVPTKESTKGLFLEVVQNKKNMLRHIPPAMRTREICSIAIEHNPYEIVNAPLHIIDEKMCLSTVQKDGLMLKEIPEQFRNYQIYLEAVKNNPVVISEVPKKLQKKIMRDSKNPNNRSFGQKFALMIDNMFRKKITPAVD